MQLQILATTKKFTLYVGLSSIWVASASYVESVYAFTSMSLWGRTFLLLHSLVSFFAHPLFSQIMFLLYCFPISINPPFNFYMVIIIITPLPLLNSLNFFSIPYLYCTDISQLSVLVLVWCSFTITILHVVIFQLQFFCI